MKRAKGSVAGKKSVVATSLLVGMVLGLVVAALLAWYLTQKNPPSFKAPPVVSETPKPAPPPAMVPAPPPATPPTTVQPEPQFEFFQILPGQTDEAVKQSTPPAPVAKPKASPTDTKSYFVQAGSFQSAADAEKLKAKLALAGYEATVQSVDLPGKGIWHRVRLGPYRGLAAANEAIASLKMNGVANATVVVAQ